MHKGVTLPNTTHVYAPLSCDRFMLLSTVVSKTGISTDYDSHAEKNLDLNVLKRNSLPRIVKVQYGLEYWSVK